MFFGCTSLTQAPSLSAMTLAKSCYALMFSSCNGLTQTPELPATTLADTCYMQMFQYCKNLKKAILPNATVYNVYLPYAGMFKGCTNLNYIKALFDGSGTTVGATWVEGVATSGTFVKRKGYNYWSTGTDGIPSGWTVQEAES